MRCYNCGSQLPEGAKYCLSCGRKVGDKSGVTSDNLEGKGSEDHPERLKTKAGKRIAFPRLLRWMFTFVLLFLIIMIFLHAK